MTEREAEKAGLVPVTSPRGQASPVYLGYSETARCSIMGKRGRDLKPVVLPAPEETIGYLEWLITEKDRMNAHGVKAEIVEKKGQFALWRAPFEKARY